MTNAQVLNLFAAASQRWAEEESVSQQALAEAWIARESEPYIRPSWSTEPMTKNDLVNLLLISQSRFGKIYFGKADGKATRRQLERKPKTVLRRSLSRTNEWAKAVGKA